jgi:hypothetical protein
MSDSMGEAVWQAAKGGNEAELGRLIGLGGNVNWYHRDVRRRMCLAWAPASSSLLLLRSPSPPTRRSPDTNSPQLAARRAAALAAPPPRRPAELGTRVVVSLRAAPPRARPRSSRVLALDDSSCLLHVPSTDSQL